MHFHRAFRGSISRTRRQARRPKDQILLLQGMRNTADHSLIEQSAPLSGSLVLKNITSTAEIKLLKGSLEASAAGIGNLALVWRVVPPDWQNFNYVVDWAITVQCSYSKICFFVLECLNWNWSSHTLQFCPLPLPPHISCPPLFQCWKRHWIGLYECKGNNSWYLRAYPNERPTYL